MWQFRIDVQEAPTSYEINQVHVDMPPDRWEWRVYITTVQGEVMMAGGSTIGRRAAILAGTKWLTEYATEEY